VVGKQFIITGAGKLEKKNLDLDQGNWRQHNGTDKRTTGQRYIYRERYISRVKATRRKSRVKAIRKWKSC
jgi:hypothetical protein